MKSKDYSSLASTCIKVPFTLLLVLITFSSCSYIVPTYLRNFTDEIAIVHIFFLNKPPEHRHADSVKVANSIIDFDSSYYKSFDSSQEVLWVDANHLSFEIHPNTTVNLWDVGAHISPYTSKNFTVTLTRGNKFDTVANGITGYLSNDIKYKRKLRALLPSNCYYDIKN
jgi:hypothetical protein